MASLVLHDVAPEEFDEAARRLVTRSVLWGAAWLAALTYLAFASVLAAGGRLGWFGDHTNWNSSTLVQHADEHFARAALDWSRVWTSCRRFRGVAIPGLRRMSCPWAC